MGLACRYGDRTTDREETAMKSRDKKQLIFLVLAALILVFIMSSFLVTTANAQSFGGTMRQNGEWDWDGDWDRYDRTSPLIRYNRVEGLLLGFTVNRDYWRDRRPVSPIVFGDVGYAFSAKELEYQVGLEQGFTRGNRFAIGAEHHRRITTPDNWFISEDENSLAAFLIKEDFCDYYLSEGGSVYFTQRIGRSLEISGGYSFERFDSLEVNTKWSLFGKNKKFRDNPAMDAGVVNSIRGSLVFDTRRNARYTARGWYAEIDFEHAGEDLGGDFTFDRLVADIRRYQPLGFDLGIDFRLRAGTASGMLPFEKSYHLGGIGTLRGYPYKSFPAGFEIPGGNRMLLAQVEYRLGESNFDGFLDLGLFDIFNLVLFADAGWVGYAEPDAGLLDGFGGLSWEDFRSDAGIAFTSGNVRFEIARRLDTGHKPFRFYFRITRPF